MPLTVAEIENATNAGIAYHFQKGNVKSQSLQNKPLLKALRAKQKTFPGGVSIITRRVKFAYTTTIMGFEGDDVVSYANPTNIRTCNYPWKMIHAGISFTKDELLKNGITISDSLDGTGDRSTARAELIRLANVLEDKLEDMEEGWNRGFNSMFWQDGTQDSKVVPGIRSFVLDNPTSAIAVGGIDQNANPLWQNRASLALSTGSAANQVVVQKLQNEFRQLRRYGGNPNLALCGSSFLDWFEQELRAKGNYTLEGWARSGRIDASVADVEFKGVSFEYDPTLDDLGLAKYLFLLDTRTIYPMVIDGEDEQKHAPARPENRYVFYRAMTWAGGLVCDQRNANGVYSIA
jgi:hypothetical protein